VFSELVIDAADPELLARFWSEVLGWPIDPESNSEEAELANPDGSKPTLLFVRVTDPKVVKNRVHIDVSPVGADQPEELERLLALGARPVDIGQGEQTWYVLADPEDNEFCLLRTRLD